MNTYYCPYDFFTEETTLEEIKDKIKTLPEINMDEVIPCTGLWITKHGFWLGSGMAFTVEQMGEPDPLWQEAKGIHLYIETTRQDGTNKAYSEEEIKKMFRRTDDLS